MLKEVVVTFSTPLSFLHKSTATPVTATKATEHIIIAAKAPFDKPDDLSLLIIGWFAMKFYVSPQIL